MAARGSLAISENFGDLLDPRFSKIYTTEYAERIKTSMIPMLFGMIGPGQLKTKSSYRVSGVGAMSDLEDFDGQIAYDTFSQLYDKTFEFPEKALGFKVERKLHDDDEFGIMDQRPRQLAISAARTREKKAANMYNTSFVGTDGPDSLSLFNASHPYSPDDATTQSNRGTSALSATSIEATRRIGFTSIMNDRGELLDVNYDLLLVPPNLEETAWEVINSRGKVETADNNANFHYGKYQLAMWPRLTDTNNWFFLDSTLLKLFYLWMDRVKGTLNYDRDFDTLQAKWSFYERYQCGWGDWRPGYGHLVA